MQCKQRNGNFKKGSKGNVRNKNTVTATRNAFIGLINRQETFKRRISEFENMSVEISLKWGQKKTKQNEKPKTKISKNYRTIRKGVTYA